MGHGERFSALASGCLTRTWGGKTVRDRFELKFRVTPGCWLWHGDKDSKGYGRMVIERRLIKAHRLSYELHFGAIPAGMIICHKCDVRACVNPDHLFLGTDQTNVDDKMEKGRWSCGTRHPGQVLSYAKLSDDDVYAIRADGREIKYIAKDWGMSHSQIWAVKKRIKWGHLPPREDEKASPDGRKIAANRAPSASR